MTAPLTSSCQVMCKSFPKRVEEFRCVTIHKEIAQIRAPPPHRITRAASHCSLPYVIWVGTEKTHADRCAPGEKPLCPWDTLGKMPVALFDTSRGLLRAWDFARCVTRARSGMEVPGTMWNQAAHKNSRSTSRPPDDHPPLRIWRV